MVRYFKFSAVLMGIDRVARLYIFHHIQYVKCIVFALLGVVYCQGCQIGKDCRFMLELMSLGVK